MSNKNKDIKTIKITINPNETKEDIQKKVIGQMDKLSRPFQHIVENQNKLMKPLEPFKNILPKWENPANEFIKNMQNLFKWDNPINETIKNIQNITSGWRETTEKIEADKQACEGNIWYELTLNELEAKEYEIKHLKAKLEEQGKLIELIHNKTSNYYKEPQPQEKKKILAHTDPTNEIYYFKLPEMKQILNLLFEPTNSYQWQCLLNAITPPTPIEVKKKVALTNIRYFFDVLVECEIIRKDYITILCETKTIYFNNKPLKNKQLRDAKTELNKTFCKFHNEIEQIKELK